MERRGAAYTIDLGGPGRRLDFGGLAAVYLRGSEVDDGTLDILADAPGLRYLSLNETRVTDEGLAKLRNLTELSSLSLGNLGPTGARLARGKGLEALEDLPRLEQIQLSSPETSDDDLRGLARLRHLRLIDLAKNSQVTAEGVDRLKRALPDCIIRVR